MTAVIFDMDGTMIDNKKYHEKAWEVFFKRHDLGTPDMEPHMGKTNRLIMKSLFPNISLSEAIQLSEEKEMIYRDLYKDDCVPIPGIRSFLKKLKENNIPTAIATASPPENVAFVMDATDLSGYFNLIMDDTTVNLGKPDPEIYLETASRLGVEPKDCIVFEDSPNGIKSAIAAGMTVVAITTNGHEIRGAAKLIEDYKGLEVDEILNLLD